MASVTVTRSRQALPWAGEVVIVIEHPASMNTNTLNVNSVDGGQGISFVHACMGFNVSGVLVAIATQPSVSTNGVVVTVNDAAETTLIVFGR